MSDRAAIITGARGGIGRALCRAFADAGYHVVGTDQNNVQGERLDFAFIAVFLALLVSLWRGIGDLLPWLVAGGVAVAASLLVPGKWYIILGGLAGSLAGAWQSTHKPVPAP